MENYTNFLLENYYQLDYDNDIRDYAQMTVNSLYESSATEAVKGFFKGIFGGLLAYFIGGALMIGGIVGYVLFKNRKAAAIINGIVIKYFSKDELNGINVTLNNDPEFKKISNELNKIEYYMSKHFDAFLDDSGIYNVDKRTYNIFIENDPIAKALNKDLLKKQELLAKRRSALLDKDTNDKINAMIEEITIKLKDIDTPGIPNRISNFYFG